MNGNEQNFLAELDKRLALQEQRNKQQTEVYGDIKLEVGRIFERLDGLTCGKQIEKISNLEDDMKRTWQWIYGIAVFVIISGVVGIGFAFVKNALAGS